MHKKLKISALVVGLIPVAVFFWEAQYCIPKNWQDAGCGLMTIFFGILGFPATSIIFLSNSSYQEGTLWYLTTAVVAGLIYAIVFYWIIRGIQKVVVKIKEKN